MNRPKSEFCHYADYVNNTPLPDAANVVELIAKWFEDYNEKHPHSGRKMG